MEKIYLKNMKSEELKELLNNIKEELNNRESEKIIYNCENKNASNYYLKKYPNWVKILNGIDDSKTNGYAFIGNFLNIREENLIPKDSYVVEMAENTFKLFKATDNDNKELLLEGKRTELVTFIRECKKIVEK